MAPCISLDDVWTLDLWGIGEKHFGGVEDQVSKSFLYPLELKVQLTPAGEDVQVSWSSALINQALCMWIGSIAY